MIVIATSNKNKVIEFKRILPEYDFVCASDLNLDIDVKEDGSTFLENSLIKAMHVASQTNYPVIADDSGLEVKDLNNFPGIYSARFASPIKDYKIKCEMLLKMLPPSSNKEASFKCGIVLIDNDGSKYEALGECKGHLNTEYLGEHGFGYDGIFIPDGFDQTFGQLDDSIKDSMSHRANALRKVFSLLPDRFIRRHKIK